MKKKKDGRIAEIQEIAKVVQGMKVFQDRKLPLLLSYGKIRDADVKDLDDPHITVHSIMPEIGIIEIEIVPREKVLSKLETLKRIKSISIARWLEVT
jgi:hypothetical protein